MGAYPSRSDNIVGANLHFDPQGYLSIIPQLRLCSNHHLTTITITLMYLVHGISQHVMCLLHGIGLSVP